MARLCALLGLLSLVFPANTSAADCRAFPGDADWPSEKEWATLNKTVSGRLVATTPIGSPCHQPSYDAAACALVREGWHDPAFQYASIAQSAIKSS